MLKVQHRQSDPSATEQFAKALKLPRFCDAHTAHKVSAGDMASMAAGPVSAITQYTGHSPHHESQHLHVAYC